MACVDEYGSMTEPTRPMTPSDDEIERSRDITIVRLRSRNLPWRKIGKYLGMSHEGVRHRYKRIPAEAREHYSRSAALA